MNIQIIEKDGQPEWAILPYEAYLKLREDADMLQDIHDYDQAKVAMAEGEELVPSEIVYAILDGNSPIKVWREYRNLTQQQLAERVGISKSYLSQLESGKRTGTVEALTAVAQALGLSLDDIVD
jgi:DNA-binding XRE family transcriptional regulator